MHVEEELVSVTLALSFPSDEWLGWPHFLDPDPIILDTTTAPSAPLTTARLDAVSFPLARLWESTGISEGRLNWRPERETLEPMDQLLSKRSKTGVKTESELSWTLDPPGDFYQLPSMLEIKDALDIHHFIALPPTTSKVQIVVSIRGVEETTPHNVFAIQIMSQVPQAEMVLRYLHTGAFRQAKQIADEVNLFLADLSPRLVEPMYAIANGYYLLRIDDLKEFGSWWRGFFSIFSGIPDILVIDAWQMLQRAVDDNYLLRARERLIQAANLGVPVYTQGVRLLLDGLEMFARRTDTDAKFVVEALTAVRNYIDGIDWRQQLTTFISEDPVFSLFNTLPTYAWYSHMKRETSPWMVYTEI